MSGLVPSQTTVKAPSDGDQASLDSAIFRRVLGHYPTGVCVVTTIEPGGTPVGMVIGSFSSVSLDPPLVGFMAGKSSTSWPRIARAGHFCVNVLASGQQELCRRFAGTAVDRFDGLDFDLSTNGSPLLRDIAAWSDCAIHSVLEAGDHYIVLGKVQHLGTLAHDPLLFLRGQYGCFARH